MPDVMEYDNIILRDGCLGYSHQECQLCARMTRGNL